METCWGCINLCSYGRAGTFDGPATPLPLTSPPCLFHPRPRGCGCWQESSDGADETQVEELFEGPVGKTLSWLQLMPLSYRAISATQTLVATRDVYEKIWRVKPKIGGLYQELSDLIADSVAKPFFEKFITKQCCLENLKFYLEVEELTKAKPFSDAAWFVGSRCAGRRV